MRLVRRTQRRAVAHEQRTGAVRQEESLVRIERQRVGTRQARQQAAQLFDRVEERAVRAVHVVPHPF